MVMLRVTEPVDVSGIVDLVDTTRVTGWNVVSAIAIVVGGFIVGRILMVAIKRFFAAIDGIPAYAGQLIGRMAYYIVVFAGIAWALTFIGVDLVPLISSVAIAVVILAFALRGIFENFAAGLILQARGPFRPGDEIETNGYIGEVVEVNARATVIDTIDGRRVAVPSSTVLDNPIVNFMSLGARRTTLEAGLAYGSDLSRAREVVAEAVSNVEVVLAEPAPEVLVHEFADSTITLSVYFWHGPSINDELRARNDTALAVEAALVREGIRIAFPQRTLWWGADHPSPSPPA